uniref:Uncharacterized protein n=1 Tax=Meloidogyne incognita TaxID=6306 RepID=A0A914MRL5_MELIC
MCRSRWMGNIITNHQNFSLVKGKALGRSFKKRNVVESKVLAVHLVNNVLQCLCFSMSNNILCTFQCNMLRDNFVISFIIFEQSVSILGLIINQPERRMVISQN